MFLKGLQPSSHVVSQCWRFSLGDRQLGTFCFRLSGNIKNYTNKRNHTNVHVRREGTERPSLTHTTHVDATVHVSQASGHNASADLPRSLDTEINILKPRNPTPNASTSHSEGNNLSTLSPCRDGRTALHPQGWKSPDVSPGGAIPHGISERCVCLTPLVCTFTRCTSNLPLRPTLSHQPLGGGAEPCLRSSHPPTVGGRGPGAWG